MCSSRIEEDGRVVITQLGGEGGYEVGRTFWPLGQAPESTLAEQRRFDDFLARMALSTSSNGRAHAAGADFDVRPAAGELERYIELGLIDASLVEEPASPS